jgi:hypothetical protein
MIVYHPRAKTTIEIRKEIKENTEGLTVREQVKYNISTKTIMKWGGKFPIPDPFIFNT